MGPFHQGDEQHQSPNYTVTDKAKEPSADLLEKQVEPKAKTSFIQLQLCPRTFSLPRPDATSFSQLKKNNAIKIAPEHKQGGRDSAEKTP